MEIDSLNHKKIVIFTPERLGDTLMCTPAIAYLKYYYPDVKINIIALSELSKEVLANNPDIHNIFVLPSLKLLKNPENHYDYAINLHDEPVGRNYITALNIPAVHIAPPNPQLHQAEQALLFVQNLTPQRFPILDCHRQYRLFSDHADKSCIINLLQQKNIDFKQDILIGCQIGCHSISKRKFLFSRKISHPKIWPLEHIQALADLCYLKNSRIKIIITGSQSEKKLAKKLKKYSPNIIDCVDQTNISQLQILLQYLKVFISSDTGLMHAACSANIPLIALFGPTCLKRTGPYLPDSANLTVIQEKTMRDISPGAVFKAVMQQLDRL